MSYYLYGLQRSGTNVLQAFLEYNFDIKFNNSQNRQLCSHKHFRVYDNKNIIPHTDVINQYYNNIIINSIEELDEKLGDTNNSNKYIIIYKNIFSWLPSIKKWADNCNWITNKNIKLIDDYLNYINKWHTIKNDRVLFINYEEYIKYIISNSNTESLFLKRINTFLNKDIYNLKYKAFKKVNCSSVFNQEKLNYYVNEEYLKYFTKKEIKKIKKKKLYQKIVEYK